MLNYIYNTTGPTSFPSKSINRNGILNNGMPFKSINMSQGNIFSSNRLLYSSYVNPLKGEGHNMLRHSSSDVMSRKKSLAIGKSSKKIGLNNNNNISYKSTETNSIKNSLSRVRGGGSVAPKKKSSINNPYKSGGGSLIHSAGNRQI